MAKTDTVVPARYFRHEVAYRSIGISGAAGVTRCGFVVHDQDHDLRLTRRETHTDFAIWYVLRGSARFIDAQAKAHDLTVGQVAQMPAGGQYALDPRGEAPFAACILHMDPGFVDQLARLGCLDAQRPVLQPGLHVYLVEQFEQILHGLRHGPDTSMPWMLLQAHQLLLEIHHRDELHIKADPDGAAVAHACRRLSENLDREVALEGIAAELNITEGRLRTAFRQRVGVEPHDYRLMKRIDHARSLLAERRIQIREIAAHAGFEDPVTFARQFKRVVGQSPEVFQGA